MIVDGINIGNLIWNEDAILRHKVLRYLRFAFGISLRGYSVMTPLSLHESSLLRQLDALPRAPRIMPLIAQIAVGEEKTGFSPRDFALILGRRNYASWSFPVLILVQHQTTESPKTAVLEAAIAELRRYTRMPLIMGISTRVTPKQASGLKVPEMGALCVTSTSPEGDEMPHWIQEYHNAGGTKPVMVAGKIAHRLIPDIFSAGAEALVVSSFHTPWKMRKLVQKCETRLFFDTKRTLVGTIIHTQKGERYDSTRR